MIRMFKYDNCSEWEDFPNGVFRDTSYETGFEYNKDKVTINGEPFRLSSTLHIHGSGSPANSIQSSLFTKVKTNVKQAFLDLFNC